ncbi:HdeD family acid-resistance protein [Microlunatus ginsengisoli]|uniref:HdeD family acid-resistance protein n=1 Tax=Microlunatus ginsengisoli TaxID=363863 RepID=A0ABP7A969_9ACTN
MSEPVVYVSEEFSKTARHAWIWQIVRGALAIIFGILALFWPLQTAVALALLVGIFALVDGIVDIVDAIRFRGSPGVGLRVFLGIVSLLFGALVLFWPQISLAVLAVLVAIWAILIGALQIIANISLRKESGRSWVWGVVAGAIGVIFGIVVLITPKAGVITLIWLLGIWAIVFGIILIVLGLQLRKAASVAIVAP